MKIDVGSLTQNFSDILQANLKDQYKCFRTEVRDTGIFTCGVHKGDKWTSEKSDCPEVGIIMSQAIYSLYDAIDSTISAHTGSSSGVNLGEYELDEFLNY